MNFQKEVREGKVKEERGSWTLGEGWKEGGRAGGEGGGGVRSEVALHHRSACW